MANTGFAQALAQTSTWEKDLRVGLLDFSPFVVVFLFTFDGTLITALFRTIDGRLALFLLCDSVPDLSTY